MSTTSQYFTQTKAEQQVFFSLSLVTDAVFNNGEEKTAQIKNPAPYFYFKNYDKMFILKVFPVRIAAEKAPP